MELRDNDTLMLKTKTHFSLLPSQHPPNSRDSPGARKVSELLIERERRHED